MNNDLISRSELKKEFGYTDEWYKGRTVCAIIDNAPTVEIGEDGIDIEKYSDRLYKIAYEKGKAEAERPQGEWVYVTMSTLGLQIARCTNCNEKAYGMTDFCPNCGADMRGKNEKRE